MIKQKINRCKGTEKGQVLILMLCLLAIGGITISTSLDFVSTGIITAQIHKSEMRELYSAGAGADLAIWSVSKNVIPMSPGDVYEMPQFTLNSKTVDITINNTFDAGNLTFRITSVAASSNHTNTTIKTHIKCEPAFFENYFEYYEDDRFELAANETYTGNIWLKDGNANIDLCGNLTGHLFAESGNLLVQAGAWITGNIYCLEGNVRIEEGAVVIGRICCPAGNVWLQGTGAYVEGEINAATNVKLAAGSAVHGNVYYGEQLQNDGTINGQTYNSPYFCRMLDRIVNTLSWIIE